MMAVEQISRDVQDRKKPELPSQVVLVLQGGGALAAYQVGVYEALHAAGIEPDWVIGTSMGAINGAIIASNAVERRMDCLQKLWARIEQDGIGATRPWPWIGNWATLQTLLRGIPGLFSPNPAAAWGMHVKLGAERAAFYSTEALRSTLPELVDFDHLPSSSTRLTMGAVNIRTGRMHYFDSRDMIIGVDHVLASSALPPAFPAVRIDDEPYWDGGIYSNTPIEVVFDDYPRRSSVVFAVQLWHAAGPDPQSIWQVLNRQKDIQYASRATSHVVRQTQIHELRRVIRELVRRMPETERETPEIKELAGYGCGTIMHIVELNAPRLDGEDYTRDIDFTADGIHARWQAGFADARRALDRRPWETRVDPMVGVAVYDSTRQFT
jgi:NTE family protein